MNTLLATPLLALFLSTNFPSHYEERVRLTCSSTHTPTIVLAVGYTWRKRG